MSFPCCTALHELSSSMPPENGRLAHSAHVLSATLDVSAELIHLVWARLLYEANGGKDLILRFHSPRGLLQVHSESWSLEPCTSSARSGRPATAHTGIFTRIEPAHPKYRSLWLEHDEPRSVVVLYSAPNSTETEISFWQSRFTAAVNWVMQRHQIPAERFIVEEIAIQNSILNARPRLLNGPQLLHELVTCRDDKVTAIDYMALDGSRTSLSYRSLHGASDHWASILAESFTRHSAGKCKTVPILIPQSPELYIGLLAILKAGGTFCPLNTDAPIDRINFICNDVGAKVAFTTAALKERLSSASHIQIIVLDEPIVDDQSFSQSVQSVEPSSLAYVMYTSGSTGAPKGVGVSHLAASQSLLAHDRYIPQFSRFLQFAAPTFDVSIFEIFFPLFRDCTIVSCERTRLLNDLPNAMNMMTVDAAELTPTVAGGLLKTRAAVPSLQLLLTIGEMLTPQVVTEFAGGSGKPGILWAMYGPTECAIHCTLQPAFEAASPVGNIGVTFDTTSAFIVAATEGPIDASTMRILPVGEAGELVIGGHQLATEYLNRPEQNATAFFETEQFGRLYRTGDKARLSRNGLLECLGRISAGQVKLRGQRVELGEIELAITKIPECSAAIAGVVTGRLIVWCLKASCIEISKSLIIEKAMEWLPQFMVPSDIVFIEELPQLPSGKVDRKRLERDYEKNRGHSMTGPDSGTQEMSTVLRQLLQACKDIVGSKIDADAPLNTTGIDSLLAIRLAASLRSLDFRVNAIDIIEARSARRLAARIEQQLATKQIVDERLRNLHKTIENFGASVLQEEFLRPKKDHIDRIIPATPLQEAMLAENAQDPRRYCNWIELAFEAEEGAASRRLEEALKQLIAANDILRTGFYHTNDSEFSYAQVVWRPSVSCSVSEVQSFSRTYTLETRDALLHPFQVEIVLNQNKSRALLKIPHFLYDGWSIDLLLHDLNCLLHNEQPKQRPQFAIVSSYFAGLKSQKGYQAAEAYWKKTLEGCQIASLPNFTGLVGQRQEHGKSSLTLATPFDEVTAEARKLEISPQTFFQAALAYILRSYLGTDNVILGNVSSGRTLPIPGIESVIGPCVATLPLRLDFARMLDAESMLKTLNNANRAMAKHCMLPLQEVNRCAGLLPGQSLFDVLFAWQQTSEDSSMMTDLLVRQVDTVDHLEFPLLVEVEPGKNSIIARATFDKSVIPSSQVDLLLLQIDELSRYFIRNHSNPIGDLTSAFSESALSIVRTAFTAEGNLDNPARSVEIRAAKHPHNAAVSFYSEGQARTITYQELNEASNQVAHQLRALGVKHSDLVGICMEKSLDLYINILAILKCEAGYLPLTPETPSSRIEAILIEAEVKLCLCDEDILALPSVEGCRYINLRDLPLSSQSTANLDLEHNGSDISYAIFTSGSTGKPKGVLVTMDNLASNLLVLSRLYPHDTSSKLLQSCSQAFDVSVFEIFWTWYTGMCLCTAVKDDIYGDIEGFIRTANITHLSLTPTVASLIRPDKVPTVTFLVTAGEGVTDHVHRTWADRGLYQGYGPSETTNICSVLPRMTHQHAINNVGPGFENTSTFVMEEGSTNFVPRGGVGELVFGGDQVFRGYLKRPDLNAQKILQHPKFGRLYRSGDLGRILSDGSISFAGRADDQIKLRGHRIELGEITSRAKECHDIAECVSMACDLSGGKEAARLVTFFVPERYKSRDFTCLAINSATKAMIASIFEILTANLPSYMIPSNIVPISALPMTPSSKVDKRLLVKTFQELPSAVLDSTALNIDVAADDGEDWTANELAIASILEKSLGLSRSELGRNTSFFGLGVDSIKAIVVSKQLNTLNRGRIPVSAIMRNPTISRLAKQLKHGSVDDSSHLPLSDPQTVLRTLFPERIQSAIHRRVSNTGQTVQKVLPCTPLQDAMLAAGASLDHSAYVNRVLFEVHGDMDRLQAAWRVACVRHEILRTCFVPTEDSQFAFAQVVVQKDTPEWVKLTSTDENLHSQVDNIAIQSISEAISNAKVPLYFVSVETPSRKMLAFCCHHALYDGAAVAILLREVEQLYHEASLSPAPTIDAFLAAVLATDENEADTFWSSCFESFEPSAFPSLTGASRSARDSRTERKLHVKDISLSFHEIENACRSCYISLSAAAQAAWAKTLAIYLGEEDVCFGSVYSGRTLPLDDLNRLVAPCFNTLPIRINLANTETNLVLMQQLQQFNADVLPFQMTPLRRIQARFSDDGKRLFDTLFILQQPQRDLDQGLWSIVEDTGYMDLPMVIELSPKPERDVLTMHLHFDTDFATNAEVDAVFGTYEAALRTTLFDSLSSVRAVNNLPSDLVSISSSDLAALPPQQDRLLQTSFEHNVETRGKSIALDFLMDDGSRVTWSFNELNRRANQIANALLENGLELEDAVPIHLSKSPCFYASVLGVLKAGGAFTPFDPTLPESRKRFMFEELGAKVILCQKDADVAWCERAIKIEISATQNHSYNTVAVANLTETSLAYRLYTSGSTGKPKAVSVEHHSPVHTVESSKTLIPWNTESRLLQYAATTFDMCYYDCFLAWTFGFCLCAAEQTTMFNDLPSVINVLNASILDLTPSVAKTLTPQDVDTVNYLYCIGEAMSQEIVDRWEGKCVNSYGPTEAAFCCTIKPVDKRRKASVIGKPFPSARFTILSIDGSCAVPVLGAGELHIEGPQVARGYHANHEMTESRFITWEGRRLYKTGDQVRMLTNGDFEFLGRVDDQVKIRGLRVELDEISAVIRRAHVSITSAVTLILRVDQSTTDQLVTAIACRNANKEEHVAAVKTAARDAAREQLPAYMVPNFMLVLDQIPLSAAGKLDRKAIKALFSEHTANAQDQQDGDVTYEWTKTEEDVREVLAGLAKQDIQTVRHDTTIYQLGLDSISAVQMAAQLRAKGYEIMAGEILRYPSCTALADQLEKRTYPTTEPIIDFDFKTFDEQRRDIVTSIHNIDKADLCAIRPCTPLQRGLISQFMQSSDPMYFNYVKIELDASLHAEQYKQAFAAVAVKHEILRSGFVDLKEKENPLVMLTYHCSSVDKQMTILHERHWSKDRARQWQQKAANESRKALNQPPWRIVVIESESRVAMHLAMLHALYDAQSLQTILQDFDAACRGKGLTKAQDLNTVINTIIHGSQLNGDSQTFWKDMGKNMFTNRFPNLHPLQTTASGKGVAELLSKTTTENFDQGCRSANTTIQAAGQAAWARLLASYLGEAAVTFGVVLSGRMDTHVEEVAFPCITTVPVACQNSESNRELLTAMLQLNADVRKHQFTPLIDIQRLTGHSDSGLFDTIFAYQKFSNSSEENRLWKIVDDIASDNYSIAFELEPSINGKLLYRITYEASLLPSEQVDCMLKQFDALFHELVFSPDGTTSSHYDGKESIYSITPPKDEEIPSTVRLLHEFVEASAREHPNKIALEFASSLEETSVDSQTWTYAELDAQGNRMANILIEHQIHPGDLIAVCFDKCAEASFAMLGVLKAGCAFVAIDPTAPDARKSYIVGDSGAKAFLSMDAASSNFADQIHVPLINLDGGKLDTVSSNPPRLSREVLPQDCSYCLYTSGTTGNPKGCELTHENAVQAMMSFQRLFTGHWDADSRWLQFASFHFDVSVLEQYWSWAVGIRVVSAPRDLILSDIPGTIQRLGITHIDLTPSLARTVHPDDVPSLCRGVFITGGESLKQEILDVWGPHKVIYNGYGPTEATIGCTMYPRVSSAGKPSNIGPQFDNVGSFVLKAGTEIPVLRGAVGELCVSGKLVGKGYLNRPDLTAKAFPTLQAFDKRVYRTGDLVRILHNGDFQFLGRADDQVKLRGQRLEIGEINSVIKQGVSAVQDVATLVLKHAKQQREQLVSFVATTSSARRDVKTELLMDNAELIADVKEACQARLAGYMVPTHIIPLTSIPLSANNKADGKQLKALYNELSSQDLQKLAASSSDDKQLSQHEVHIRDVLASLPQIESTDIGRNTSIFELGLDSISVIGFASALKKAGYRNAHPSMVMRNSTVARLSKALQHSITEAADPAVLEAKQSISALQHQFTASAGRSLGIKADEIEAIAPCTPLQQGMITRLLESESPVYFNTFNFELSGKVDPARLKDAWERIFRNTDALRLQFAACDAGYVQVLTKKRSMPWDEMSCKSSDDIHASISDSTQAWWQNNQEQLRTPFELALTKSPERTVLSVRLFHAIYDGNSLPMILDLVLAAYATPEEAPTNRPQFFDVLHYGPLRQVVEARDFFKSHLQYATSQRFLRNKQAGDEGSCTTMRALSITDDYAQVRKTLNVADQAIMQVCWAAVLQKQFSGSASLGIVVSGRSIAFEGTEKVIGPLFNTIPFHIRFADSQSWQDAVARCQEFNLEALPFHHTPLRDILKWTKHTSSNPLFENLFVLQKEEEGADQWSDNALWKLVDGVSPADYPVALEVLQKADGDVQLTLVTQNAICDKEGAEKLLDEFQESFNALLRNAKSPISETMGHIEQSQDVGIGEQRTQLKPETAASDDFKWTPEAEKIRQSIADVAGIAISEIGPQTSIFETGLDSIDAIKLSASLKKKGINLPVSKIMRCLTVAKMSAQVSQVLTNGNTHTDEMSAFEKMKRELEQYMAVADRKPSDVEAILPATPLQEAMVAEMVNSSFERYFNHDVLELHAGVEVTQLKRAWTDVVQATPMLRTTFQELDDPKIDATYAQLVHRFEKLAWAERRISQESDLHNIPSALNKEAAKDGIGNDLFRLTMVVHDNKRYLILSIAHALYDGWALGLLHQDVTAAYRETFHPRPDNLEALSDILVASGVGADTFWKDFLFGAANSPFPRTINEQQQRHVYRDEVTSDISSEDISKFCKQSGISMQALGQTCWSFVLASYTHSLDVIFGVVLSGRDSEAAEDVLFPTMNTVAVRSVIHGTKHEMLKYVQDNMTSVRQYQHFPLRKAQALAGKQGSNLFDTLFIYQRRPESGQASSDSLYDSIGGQSDVEYPVCVEMEVVGTKLVWRCACEGSVLDYQGSREMLDRLNGVLGSIVKDAGTLALQFSNDGTAVCGLPAFRTMDTLKEDADGDSHVNGVTDEQWSEVEDKIREVLSKVSKTPVDEITKTTHIYHLGLDSITGIKVSALLKKEGIKLSHGAMLQAGTVAKIAAAIGKQGTISKNPASEKIPDDRVQLWNDKDFLRILDTYGLESTSRDAWYPATATQVHMLSTWLNSRGGLFEAKFFWTVQGQKISEDSCSIAWAKTVEEELALRSAFISTGSSIVPFVHMDRNLLPFTFAQTLPPSHTISFTSDNNNTWSMRLGILHAFYDANTISRIIQRFQSHLTFSTPVLPASLPPPNHRISALETRKSHWKEYLSTYSPPSRPFPQPYSTPPTTRAEVFKPKALPSSAFATLKSLAQHTGVSLDSLLLSAYSSVFSQHVQSSDVLIGVYMGNAPDPAEAPVGMPTLSIVPLRIQDPQRESHGIEKVAHSIERDINALRTNPQAASIGLWELDDWLGIQVETFVNILHKRNRSDVEEDEKGEGSKSVTIKDATHSIHGLVKPRAVWTEMHAASDDVQDFIPPDTLKENPVGKSYPHAVDIEFGVHEDGLDVGLFCPEGLLDDVKDGGPKNAEEFVERVVRELERMVEG